MSDVETLVSQVLPYIRSAIDAYGRAVLSQTGKVAASGTVGLGQRILSALLRRGGKDSEVGVAVERLAAAPNDPAALGDLHARIGRALREEPGLAAELSAMVETRVSWSTVSGHHNVGVGGDHQGPIHLGDNTSNVHHTVHNTVHERKISGLSIAALVLGLLGFLILPIPVAVVLGIIALVQVLKAPSSTQLAETGRAGGAPSGPGGPSMSPEAQGSMAGPTVSAGPSGPGAFPPSPTPSGPGTPSDPGAHTGPWTPSAGGPGAPVDPGIGAFPPPVPEPAGAAASFTPSAAPAAAFAPAAGGGGVAAGGGFAAAKAISVVFAVFGLLAACLWGLGWTAAVVVLVEAETVSQASGDTDTGMSGTEDPFAGGEEISPADLCEPSPGYATVCTLESGDCFLEPAGTEFYEVELTSCGEAHDAQVIGSYSPSGEVWPGWGSFDADIDATCGPMSEQALDPALTPSTYYVGYIAPNESAWDYGIREAFCYVSADGESWTTSLLW
ncbi:septum formation family protein [Nocardiopsis alba]|uniref:Septum formation family protein n=2 Tax=Nocardiopsis alba TaxID=53437 RepID=A0ABV5E192_9ACTN